MMDFEQMKTVWDAQSERRVLGLEPQVLQPMIAKRSREWAWSLAMHDLAICIVCIVGPGINGHFSGEYGYETVSAVINVGIILFILGKRVERKRRERSFAATLLGDLDRAIYRIRCLGWWMRNFMWWFVAPTAAYTMFSLTHHFTWSGCIAGLVGYPLIALWVPLMGRRVYGPEEANLESLRSKLIDLG